ncbi:uncharacterized protein LOC134461737 [Engraulis encrasicolus]|uniref:uncharacterized protein LOC134461737 n=1 Tax=Engraulis encrasicolus TaxID=184585 RepID=UPI002FD6943E
MAVLLFTAPRCRLRSTTLSLVLSLLQFQLPLTLAEDCAQRIRVERVSVSSSVTLSCPRVTGVDDLTVTLRKEDAQLHNYTLKEKLLLPVNVSQRLHLRVDEGGVAYELHQVTREDAGVYICSLEKVYPPPYKKEANATVLYIDEPCPQPVTSGMNGTLLTTRASTGPQTESHGVGSPETQTKDPLYPQSVWVAICVSLAVLCLLLLITSLTLGHKLRRNGLDNDYVNTPKVQHPKWAEHFRS